jgi:hypothetical protein
MDEDRFQPRDDKLGWASIKFRDVIRGHAEPGIPLELKDVKSGIIYVAFELRDANGYYESLLRAERLERVQQMDIAAQWKGYLFKRQRYSGTSRSWVRRFFRLTLISDSDTQYVSRAWRLEAYGSRHSMVRKQTWILSNNSEWKRRGELHLPFCYELVPGSVRKLGAQISNNVHHDPPMILRSDDKQDIEDLTHILKQTVGVKTALNPDEESAIRLVLVHSDEEAVDHAPEDDQDSDVDHEPEDDEDSPRVRSISIVSHDTKYASSDEITPSLPSILPSSLIPLEHCSLCQTRIRGDDQERVVVAC